MTGFDLDGRHVGDGSPCLIVAEVGMAHDGSLALAHSYIDEVAYILNIYRPGHAIKFQCHIAEAESTSDEPWRVAPQYRQDVSRQAYWARTEFTSDQWRELAEHAKERGLIFLCSPFSVRAVNILNDLVPAWKIASGEVGNLPMLEAIKATGKPVILSTGMSTEKEIRSALVHFGWVDSEEAVIERPLALLQSVSMYPTPLHKVGLNVLEHHLYQHAYQVGLSDHSGTPWPSIAAITMGASIVEVHVTFDRRMQGFDADSSIDLADLGRIADYADAFEKMKVKVDKDELARTELAQTREIFLNKWRRKAAQQ